MRLNSKAYSQMISSNPGRSSGTGALKDVALVVPVVKAVPADVEVSARVATSAAEVTLAVVSAEAKNFKE